MEKGRPAIRPAEVIGSWATTQPPGRTAAAMRREHDGGIDHVEQQEAAEGQVDRLGQPQVLAGLGDGQHLAVGGRGRGHLVAGRRVGVDGVDPPVASDDLGQGHRNVAPAGPDVDARPARADAQPVEGGGQRPPVDVVPQAAQFHPGNDTGRPGAAGPAAVRRGPRGTGSLTVVKVTMMLCDSAQVADGKLYVLGGGWSMTGPDPVPSAIALKIDVGWHEAESAHHWELYLEDADGRPVLVATPDGEHPVEVRGEFTVGRPTDVPEGSPVDVALAVNLGPLPLTRAPATRGGWPSTATATPTGCWPSPPGPPRDPTPEPAAARRSPPPARLLSTVMTTYDRPFGRYFEDFTPGDVYRHWPGKTITEADDHLFCMITMNHHPLHTNAWFAENESVQKKNVVVGNLVYSLALGMSVPDVSGAAIANLEVESLLHRAPTFHGDTIYAETKVIDKVESTSRDDRGVVTVETKAFNQRGEEVCFFRRKVMVWKEAFAPARRRPYGDDVWG